jgi:RNA polymerase sigma-70 factor (ECF subfamily)
MQFSEEKIQLIAKGSTEIFKELYDSLFYSLASFTVQLVKDSDEASDIVQEALLLYWNKRNEFETIDSVKAFLYSVIKNMGLNYLRAKKIHQKHFDLIKHNESFYFKNKIIEEETISLIKLALKNLSPQTKTIIEMSMNGAKNIDIADSLNISVNTIKTLKLRAYRNLRKKFKDHIYVLLFIADLLLK